MEKIGVSPEVLKAYLAKLKKSIFNRRLFLEKSLHRWKTLFSLKTLKALRHLTLFEINKSLDQVNTAALKEHTWYNYTIVLRLTMAPLLIKHQALCL